MSLSTSLDWYVYSEDSCSHVAHGISVFETPKPGPEGPNAINPTESLDEISLLIPQFIDSSKEYLPTFIFSKTL